MRKELCLLVFLERHFVKFAVCMLVLGISKTSFAQDEPEPSPTPSEWEDYEYNGWDSDSDSDEELPNSCPRPDGQPGGPWGAGTEASPRSQVYIEDNGYTRRITDEWVETDSRAHWEAREMVIEEEVSRYEDSYPICQYQVDYCTSHEEWEFILYWDNTKTNAARNSYTYTSRQDQPILPGDTCESVNAFHYVSGFVDETTYYEDSTLRSWSVEHLDEVNAQTTVSSLQAEGYDPAGCIIWQAWKYVTADSHDSYVEHFNGCTDPADYNAPTPPF